MDREKLLNQASIISEYLREGLIGELNIPEYDGKYKYFPSYEEFAKMDTSMIDCYVEAYRFFIVDLPDDTEEVSNAVRTGFQGAFSAEVSFTKKGV